MRRDNRVRWIFVIALVIFAVVYLYPTVEYYSLTDAEKNDPAREQEIKNLELKAIKRGLDLQGGIRLEMEIELFSLVNTLATNKDALFDEILSDTRALTEQNSEDFLTNIETVAEEKDMKLDRYFDRERRLDENSQVREVMDYLRDQADEGIQQSLNILRLRVDQFGVSEPNIYKQGARRIVVELPGVEDIELAKELIGQTAKLEFRLEKELSSFTEVRNAIDRRLRNEEVDTTVVESAPVDTTQKEQKPSTATEVDITELFGAADASRQEKDSAQTAIVDMNTYNSGLPFTSLLNFDGELKFAVESNIPVINAILERDDVKELIPGDAEFVWSAEPEREQGGVNYYELFLLYKDAELGGEVITDARVSIYQGYEPSKAGQPVILMSMDRAGSDKWKRTTGANIDKRIAIVLDGKVMSAPVVNEKIPTGKSEITGRFTMQEAKNLAINLRTGSFKADMTIIRENNVGASLGADSVKKGTYSAMIGIIMVILFMVIYYRISGVIATVVLIFNLMVIMSVLAYFHATLTLPGIAGLILTIGMAVDANVLIFERIREELQTGKTVRAAIDSGYSRAFFTILDANLTTLITAIILYQFGSGPIRGFALVLSIGILTSMFTAIVVTRLIFDFITNRWKIPGFGAYLQLIKPGINIDFLDKRKTAFIISAVLILVGIGSLIYRGGPNYGVDFKGGTVIELKFENPVDLGELRSALASVDLGASEIKEFGNPSEVLIRTEESEEESQISTKILQVIRQDIPGNPVELGYVDYVGSKVGGELIQAAIYSIVLALFSLVIYISWRFEFKFALGAIAALVHDVMITIGVFSILDKEITLAIVAALLTIVGYSLNDTIVVSDRIRENLKVLRKQDFNTMINHSLNQTLSRTIVTSLTTLIVVVILFIWGGPVIKDFAFALIIGVTIGTYSSIFIATPLVVIYREWREEKKKAWQLRALSKT